MTLFTIALITATAVFAQKPESRPSTDAEKIADALRAGPAFITNNATLLDWPSAPGGEYRVLRKGSGEWTCLPAVPGYSHDEPDCFDRAFLRWVQDCLASRKPQIDRLGIAYMYVGAWVKAASSASTDHEFHVGPHLMIVSPHQDELQGFNRDASNGMPYVTHLPNRTELFLVMPIRQWDVQ
jgi:hypothetical protein